MELYVAYASDDNYVQHVGVSMLSLYENNKMFESITVYILDTSISIENKQRLISISKEYNRNVVFFDFSDIKNFIGMEIWSDRSFATMSRLFIARYLPKNIEKILYLDCDSVINSSLEELWSIDIDDYYVAGVLDTVGTEVKKCIGLNENDIYINAGMLLINIKKWKDELVEQKLIDFFKKYKGHVPNMDQGAINGTLKNKICTIHPKFNVMSINLTHSYKDVLSIYKLVPYYDEKKFIEACNKPVIIHFTPGLANRPWSKNCCNPLKHLYIKYMNMTPWNGTVLQEDKRKLHVKLLSWIYFKLPIVFYKCSLLIIEKLKNLKKYS